MCGAEKNVHIKKGDEPMLRSKISNVMLSTIDIGKVKHILGNTPFLNSIYKIGSQALIDDQFPTHLFIESTRACNLGCTCCPRKLHSSQTGHMNYQTFTKIVDEASAYGVRNFSLHMLGEPLLHPKIMDMIRYIKKSNDHHSVLLTSNGYFLDHAKAVGLLENHLDKISFSVFSLKPDMNKLLTGRGDISHVINNIKHLALLKRQMKAKTKIFIRVIVSKENENEIPQFRTIAKEAGVLLEIRYEGNFGGAIVDNYIDNKGRIKKRHPCYHLWFSPAVTWDGKIVICCVDWKYSEILGDIRETTVATIWQGERIRQLRRHHLKGEFDKIPICANCNVWSTYPDIFFDKQKR